MSENGIGRDSDKFMLRLPDGMRDRIAATAKKNKRSMNAEIISMLEIAFVTDEEMERSREFYESLDGLQNAIPEQPVVVIADPDIKRIADEVVKRLEERDASRKK